MKILITGVHGFVGNNLVGSLKHKHTLYGLDILAPIKEGVVKTFAWNELYAISPVDAIIHLAGKAHDTKNTSAEKEYFDINVGLTKKIFDLFLASTATKFIFFSSVKASADSVSGAFLSEDVLPNPQTPYGKSKLEAERYILEQPLPPGKKIYILRPCMIHGPGNKGNLNLLYKLAQKGLPWPLGTFKNNRSFTSIDNLLFVMRELIENDIEPGTYQIADDEALSTNEIIRLMTDSLHRTARVWNISPGTINLMAKIGDKLRLPLNSERLKKLTESYIVSNQKIKKALSITKMPITATEGMRKTFGSFKKIQ